jgi:hypothetical protein
MKVFNKTISIGCIIGILAAALSVLCGAVSVRSSNSAKLKKNSILKTNGSAIENGFGQKVALRGVNLGGWLLQESWMTPVDGEDKIWGYYDTLRILTERFGEEGCKKLIESYEENWITASDLDYLAALGVNCVRVPFCYRNLHIDDNGTWKKNAENEIDFSRLDYIVEECSKRGIYVILDLHGAPGFQSDDHSTGKSDSSKLFSIGKEGSKYRDLTVELWVETAKHFNGNPAVAAYDLLNEPMNGFNIIKKCDLALWQLYDRIYRAIREVDKEHIIIFEGVWELGNLPSPAKYGWQNVIYSLHNYNYKKEEIENKIKDAQRHSFWNVPILIGEFQGGTDISEYVFNSYNNAGFSWLTWSYKGAKCEGTSGWFLFGGSPEIVNLHEDSFEEILRKWGNALQTQSGFSENKDLTSKLVKYLNCDVQAQKSTAISHCGALTLSSIHTVLSCISYLTAILTTIFMLYC